MKEWLEEPFILLLRLAQAASAIDSASGSSGGMSGRKEPTADEADYMRMVEQRIARETANGNDT